MANLNDSVGIQIMANLNVGTLEAQIQQLKSKAYTLDIGANAKNLKSANTGVKDLSKNINVAKASTTGFVYEMGVAIQRTIEWTLAVGGLYKAIRLFTDGIDFINDLNKALELNKKAYQYNPNSKGVKDNLAYTYYLIGDSDRARRMYDELLEEPVSFPEAYYNAALVSHSQGNYEEAIRLFKQALSKPFSGLTAVTQDEIQTKIDYLNRGQGGMV